MIAVSWSPADWRAGGFGIAAARPLRNGARGMHGLPPGAVRNFTVTKIPSSPRATLVNLTRALFLPAGYLEEPSR